MGLRGLVKVIHDLTTEENAIKTRYFPGFQEELSKSQDETVWTDASLIIYHHPAILKMILKFYLGTSF